MCKRWVTVNFIYKGVLLYRHCRNLSLSIGGGNGGLGRFYCES